MNNPDQPQLKPPFLIDSHAHLDSGQYDADRPETIERAHQNGISHILSIGCDLASSRKNIELAQQYEQIYAAVGVHPHDAGDINDQTLEQLRLMLDHPKVVAVGEIGLDYYRNRSPQNIQHQAFRRQIQLARKVDKPIIVHDREAHDDVLRILLEEDATTVGGVLHCFSGDLSMARKCLELGFYLSFPGPITYPKNQSTRDLIRYIPLDRILVETDCPYLSPQPHRGKRNEPAYVRHTAEKLAEIKGLSLEDVARITSRNCFNLFGLGSPDQGQNIAYTINNSLYLNLTNRCTNDCAFCARSTDFIVKGHNLQLEHEPDINEIIRAIGDPSAYAEIVFCGYGEPLLRLETVKEVAHWLKSQHLPLRINTNGQASLYHGRNILPELAGLIDAISVSLNAPEAKGYQTICRSEYGDQAYQAVKDFILEAKTWIPQVTATVVAYPGVDVDGCRRIADELGVSFKCRIYEEHRLSSGS